MKPPNTETMMSPAAMTTDASGAKALRDGEARGCAVHVGLPHSGREEQLVVHREPEQDADEDDRQEAQDRSGVRDAEQHRANHPHWKTAATAP